MRVSVEITYKNGNKTSFHIEGSKEFLNKRIKVFKDVGSELTVTFHVSEYHEFNLVAVNMKDIDFVLMSEYND